MLQCAALLLYWYSLQGALHFIYSVSPHVVVSAYRPPSTNLPKKERDERRHAKATCMRGRVEPTSLEEQPE